MVNHIAVLTNWRCPGRVGIQTEAEVRARLCADFSKGLEPTNTAVEETRRLCVQLATQLAEALQGQHLFRVNMHVMILQQGCQRFGIGRIKAGMDVINTEAQLVAQHASGTNVGGDHRLFDDAVCNTSRLGHDIQHFAFFTQNKAIVRTIFEYQRMGLTPFTAVQTDAVQQTNLCSNGV